MCECIGQREDAKPGSIGLFIAPGRGGGFVPLEERKKGEPESDRIATSRGLILLRVQVNVALAGRSWYGAEYRHVRWVSTSTWRLGRGWVEAEQN